MTETAAATKATTKFTILEQVEGYTEPEEGEPETAWKEVGVVEAGNRDQALRVFFSDTTEDVDGMFVAVTEAGWNPKPVKIKLTPDIKIG